MCARSAWADVQASECRGGGKKWIEKVDNLHNRKEVEVNMYKAYFYVECLSSYDRVYHVFDHEHHEIVLKEKDAAELAAGILKTVREWQVNYLDNRR